MTDPSQAFMSIKLGNKLGNKLGKIAVLPWVARALF